MLASAGRASTVQLPLGQLAFVGMGVFCVSNPEKFFLFLQKGTQLMLTSDFANPNNHHQNNSPAPIIIHHGGGGNNDKGGFTMTGTVVQLVVGAGMCWGSYMVLVHVLPESVKEMLPVTTGVFNRAVTSLGKAVIHLKDTLMEQIVDMLKKQDELGDRQEETHNEVLTVKHNVTDLKGDLGMVQEALDLCNSQLSESERRTNYIARGVNLLIQSVGTFLSDDDTLMHELMEFNASGGEFIGNAASSSERVMLDRAARTPEKQKNSNNMNNNSMVTPTPVVKKERMSLARTLSSSSTSSASTPVIPQTPEQDVERGLSEVRSLLNSILVTARNQ